MKTLFIEADIYARIDQRKKNYTKFHYETSL